MLLFEEVKSPLDGSAAGANPSHRQVVRLSAEPISLTDPLNGGAAVTRVTWALADALQFPLWVARDNIQDISLARGNLALADYGRSFTEWHPGSPDQPDASGIQPGQQAYRFYLQQGPLGFNPPSDFTPTTPARDLFTADPRRAEPAIMALVEVRRNHQQREWQAVMPDLLSSNRFAADFVVETDNDSRAILRFGQNEYGMMPADGSFFYVRYRVGVGIAGNIGADVLAYVIGHKDVAAMSDIAAVRNPLPAWGGAEPESIEQVKRLAPAAFRAEQHRAVTAADYARAAEKHPEVSKAVAIFRWTGSWHTVFIAIDPKGRAEATNELKKQVHDWVMAYTMTGYDLEINGPSFISLELELDICVVAGYFRSDVEQALLAALSSRQWPAGSTGFFYPDNFTFGQRLFLSQLYAAIERVIGVDSVTIKLIARQSLPTAKKQAETVRYLAQGYIEVGPLEIIRLDNDPNFPENGVLHLNMRGGK